MTYGKFEIIPGIARLRSGGHSCLLKISVTKKLALARMIRRVIYFVKPNIFHAGSESGQKLPKTVFLISEAKASLKTCLSVESKRPRANYKLFRKAVIAVQVMLKPGNDGLNSYSEIIEVRHPEKRLSEQFFNF